MENISIHEVLIIHEEILDKDINFSDFLEEEKYIKKIWNAYHASNENVYNDFFDFFNNNWYCEEIEKYLSGETLKFLQDEKFHKKQLEIYIEFKNNITIKNQLDKNAISNIRKYFLKDTTLNIVNHLQDRLTLLKEQLYTKDFYNFKKYGCSLSSKARKEEIKEIFNIEVTQENYNILDIKITIFTIEKFLNEFKFKNM